MEVLSNIDAEKTVLGCALADPTSLYRVLPLLQATDFFLDSHRQIFHVIAELAEAGKPVDEMTVIDALTLKRQLQSIGGVAYLTSLSYTVDAGLARLTNVEHYCRSILDKSRRRRARAIAERLAIQTDDISVSTDECIHQVQESLLEIEAASRATIARHIKEIMPEVLRDLETQAANQGLVGMPTGIPSLNLATGGIRPGELWTIGALPGRGKSALGAQIALANCTNGTPTYVFSLEMDAIEIIKRFLAARSEIPAMQIRNPQSIRKDRWLEIGNAAGKLVESPIYIDERSSPNIQQVVASARLFIRRYGVKLIVVDYLRLVSAPGKEVRHQVSNVANALRELAKVERIAVVLLSQLRKPEGGINAKPSMLDLIESGDVAAHSHVVLLPYLPIIEGKPEADEEPQPLLIIGKNRNGTVGGLPIFFNVERLQFVDRTKEQDPNEGFTRSPHDRLAPVI